MARCRRLEAGAVSELWQSVQPQHLSFPPPFNISPSHPPPSHPPWLVTELLDLEAFECFSSAELSGLALQYDACAMHAYGSKAATAAASVTWPIPVALAAAVSGDRLAALEAKREYQQAVQVSVYMQEVGIVPGFWFSA